MKYEIMSLRFSCRWVGMAPKCPCRTATWFNPVPKWMHSSRRTFCRRTTSSIWGGLNLGLYSVESSTKCQGHHTAMWYGRQHVPKQLITIIYHYVKIHFPINSFHAQPPRVKGYSESWSHQRSPGRWRLERACHATWHRSSQSTLLWRSWASLLLLLWSWSEMIGFSVS